MYTVVTFGTSVCMRAHMHLCTDNTMIFEGQLHSTFKVLIRPAILRMR